MKVLEGLRVLDLSNKLASNLATMYLANFGAEVIKVEKPDGGDETRKWFPIRNGESLYFNYLNNGKKSITLDITSKEGKEIFKELVKGCNVVVENFEPGYMDEIGLGFEDLKSKNPNIIYAAYSFFGQNGPDKNKPGSSLVAQAKGVAMDMTGVIGEDPIKPEPSVAEHYAAGNIATGIVLALINKKLSGGGQKIDISLVDSIFNTIEAAPVAYSTIGEIHTRKGNYDPSCAPYDTFKTNDGFVAIGVATEVQWRKLCDALDLVDLKSDPRFLTNEGRVDDYLNKLRPLVEKETLRLSKKTIEDKCRVVGVPCSAVFDIGEITDHPIMEQNKFIIEVQSEKLGKIRRPNLDICLSNTPAEIYSDAPELGSNTEKILSEIGLNMDYITNLKNNNII